jgi:tRNA(Met) C34 N-acetyltransferase TmcA
MLIPGSGLSRTKRFLFILYDPHLNLFVQNSPPKVTARFNERFLLSLTQCNSCLVLDDELNLLPLSARLAELEPVSKAAVETSELSNLKSSLAGTEFIGALLKQAKTLDQAKAVLTCLECVSEKSLRYTISVTASRGRGKSAALGIAIAGMISPALQPSDICGLCFSGLSFFFMENRSICGFELPLQVET